MTPSLAVPFTSSPSSGGRRGTARRSPAIGTALRPSPGVIVPYSSHADGEDPNFPPSLLADLCRIPVLTLAHRQIRPLVYPSRSLDMLQVCI